MAAACGPRVCGAGEILGVAGSDTPRIIARDTSPTPVALGGPRGRHRRIALWPVRPGQIRSPIRVYTCRTCAQTTQPYKPGDLLRYLQSSPAEVIMGTQDRCPGPMSPAWKATRRTLVDYVGGLEEPLARVAKLVDFCKELSGDLDAERVQPRQAAMSRWPPPPCCMRAACLLLMATALYMEGLLELRPNLSIARRASVHGWRDDGVPFEHSVRFAQTYKVRAAPARE